MHSSNFHEKGLNECILLRPLDWILRRTERIEVKSIPVAVGTPTGSRAEEPEPMQVIKPAFYFSRNIYEIKLFSIHLFKVQISIVYCYKITVSSIADH